MGGLQQIQMYYIVHMHDFQLKLIITLSTVDQHDT